MFFTIYTYIKMKKKIILLWTWILSAGAILNAWFTNASFTQKEDTIDDISKIEQEFNNMIKTEIDEKDNLIKDEGIFVDNAQSDEEISFEDVQKDMKTDLEKSELEKARKLFNQIKEYDKKDMVKEFSDAYEEFLNMPIRNNIPYDTEEGEIESWIVDFDSLKDELKKDLDSNTINKIKEKVNKIIELEKNAKFAESYKIWLELEEMNVFNEESL